MSFGDLRNFSEMMRAVGYKRLISMENFRSPNFNLMTDILRWFVLSFDTNTQIPEIQSQTSSERVTFINFVTIFMLTTANIKVNPKKLYEANGRAVKELLKIVSVLYEARRLQMKVNDEVKQCDMDGGIDLEDINVYAILSQLSSRKDELHEARKLSKQLSETSANIYFSLIKETELHSKRIDAMESEYDINKVDGILDEMISHTKRELVETIEKVEQATADELKLDSKFESKVHEMERCLRRFESLRKVRPVHQDEFNELQEELDFLHIEYLEKHQNMSFLENILERYERHEKENREMSHKVAARKKHKLNGVVVSNSKSTLPGAKVDECTNTNNTQSIMNIPDHLPLLPLKELSSLKNEKEENDDDERLMEVMKNMRDAGMGVLCDDEPEGGEQRYDENYLALKDDTKKYMMKLNEGIFRDEIETDYVHPFSPAFDLHDKKIGRASMWMTSGHIRGRNKIECGEEYDDFEEDDDDDNDF